MDLLNRGDFCPSGKWQSFTLKMYQERGYTNNILLLTLGLCEEAGAVAAAVLNLIPEYTQKPSRKDRDLEMELKDCLTYLCAIANTAGIDLEI
jgi:NTP pyrophosphatase (non-canonical NTP hydrolase)